MPSIENISGQIKTEALEGKSLGSIDRCTVTELAEARAEFPEQFAPRSRFWKQESSEVAINPKPHRIKVRILEDKGEIRFI